MAAPGRRRAIGTRAEPDWAVIHRELVRWLSVTMRQSHAGGEKLFVDYAGDTVPVIVDQLSGETRPAQIFVAAPKLLVPDNAKVAVHDERSPTIRVPATGEWQRSLRAPRYSSCPNRRQSRRRLPVRRH
jgi:hypothetical protein